MIHNFVNMTGRGSRRPIAYENHSQRTIDLYEQYTFQYDIQFYKNTHWLVIL